MNWDQYRTFATLCDRLGVTVPEPLTRAMHLADVARSHDAAPAGTLLDLTDDELRDRVVDLSIRSHDRDGRGSTLGFKPGIDAVVSQLVAEARAATLPYLDDIVVELQPRFDELAAPLMTATRDYGFTYRTSSDEVIDLADENASAAWRGARSAWSGIAPLVRFRQAMSTTFRLAPVPSGGDFSVLFAAGENWSATGRYYLEGKTQNHLDWFTLASGGIRLNTPTEVEAKIAARADAERATLRIQQPHTEVEIQPEDLDDVVLQQMPTYPR